MAEPELVLRSWDPMGPHPLGGSDGPLEIAQSTARFSSEVIRLSLGAGHGGPFEVSACPARCGLSRRRWTRHLALSCCITWRASYFRRPMCAASIERVFQVCATAGAALALAGPTQRGAQCPPEVWTELRPIVLVTPETSFSRSRAWIVSCTHPHALTAASAAGRQNHWISRFRPHQRGTLRRNRCALAW